jgi:DNA-binding NtrC family response regulator
MVAREIHKRSAQALGGFVKVTCDTQPAQNLELELFGHSRNAGDAVQCRALERIARGGRLHEALEGTVFFEQLPQMPSRVQARLARLFCDGQVAVVRERGLVNFNVRAMASVEPSYDRAVREGRIRADFDRVISTIRIELPRLRDRREDIPALAIFFVEDLCRRAKLTPKTLSEPAQQLLAALPWHGNALELRSLLKGVVSRAVRDIIYLEDVLGGVQLDGGARPFRMAGTLREARARFEQEYVAAVLEQHHGRMPEAARALGIQRTNLYRKLKRLKVPKKWWQTGN